MTNIAAAYIEEVKFMSSMLEYRGYHASVEYDAEDEIFVGEVFGISDSLNFHGTSVAELKEMFEQSIDNYLELCAKIGKTPDREFKGTFNVRISPEMHKKAALEAARQKITLNQFVTRAISQSLKSEEKEEIKERIIYIPYEIKQMSWDGQKDINLENMYYGQKEWSKKEVIKYAGN